MRKEQSLDYLKANQSDGTWEGTSEGVSAGTKHGTKDGVSPKTRKMVSWKEASMGKKLEPSRKPMTTAKHDELEEDSFDLQ
mmetsp:Transcript_42825/g.103570  ORF Transcript_42825/g.103570 Transcript_42825/m.103570 type:complete len:81 (+) Transcript_42825:388-630(+)